MAERPFIFKAGSKELILPVTPASYRVEEGVNVEIVNIHSLGDIIVMGYGTLATITIDCMLPANNYPFADDDDPEPYINQFKKWLKQKKELRFIVGGTGVNVPVKIERFAYGEQDGTNDVYATITLRKFRNPAPIQISAPPSANKARAAVAVAGASEKAYKAVYGDTLSAICRREYGDGSAATYNKLAAHNNKPNPNILMTGEILKIPKPLP